MTTPPNGLSQEALLRPKQEHWPIPMRKVLLSKYVLNRHEGNLSKVIFLDFKIKEGGVLFLASMATEPVVRSMALCSMEI